MTLNQVCLFTELVVITSNKYIYIYIDQWNQNDKDGWNRSLSFLNTSQPSTSGSIFTSSSPSLPPLPPSSSLLDTSRFYPMSSSSTSLLPSSTSMPHLYQPYPTSRPKSSVYGTQSVPFSGYNYTKSLTRPRLTTILWEDESTICYQVDCRGICVARRQGKKNYARQDIDLYR